MKIREKNIPCAKQLLKYWGEDGDFRTAFVRFYDELTTGYDAWAARNFDEPLDLDLDAIAAVLGTQRETQALRTLLRPVHGGGVTLRQIAEWTDLPLSVVVSSVLADNCGNKAEQYANLEEDLLANGVTNLSALQRKHGFRGDNKSARLLAERHNVDMSAVKPRYGSQWEANGYKREAVKLLMAGLTPTPVIRALRETFPGVTPPTVELMRTWRKREREKRERQQLLTEVA